MGRAQACPGPANFRVDLAGVRYFRPEHAYLVNPARQKLVRVTDFLPLRPIQAHFLIEPIFKAQAQPNEG